jgi:hypothetical protein
MSNNLTELTATELDAVSGGKTNSVSMNFGNFFPQSNDVQNSGAVMGSGTLTQTVNNNNNNNITGNTISSDNSGSTFNFGGFTFSI